MPIPMGYPYRSMRKGLLAEGAKEIGMVLLEACRCRCGHEWLPRIKSEKPRTCPKCKSPNWDRPVGFAKTRGGVNGQRT